MRKRRFGKRLAVSFLSVCMLISTCSGTVWAEEGLSADNMVITEEAEKTSVETESGEKTDEMPSEEGETDKEVETASPEEAETDKKTETDLPEDTDEKDETEQPTETETEPTDETEPEMPEETESEATEGTEEPGEETETEIESPDAVNTVETKQSAKELLEKPVEERLALMSSADDIASGSWEDIAWVIDTQGKLTLIGTGNLEDSELSLHRSDIKTAEVVLKDSTSVSYLFDHCDNLNSVDLSGLDTSKVTNMRNMFSNCSSLTSIDLSSWNTSNVINMWAMFSGCSSLTSIDLSGWNTSNVVNMCAMFSGCTGLANIDLGGWDTGNVTNMWAMFSNCSNLSSIDLGGLNTGNVTDMGHMFSGCSGLANIDLSEWDTRNVTDMSYMFYACSGLKSIDLGEWKTSNVTNMCNMFFNCNCLTGIDLSGWKTSNVTDMGSLFSDCSSLVDIDLRGWDMCKVTNTSNMFSNCSSLTSLDLRGWDIGNVTNMNAMFFNCSSLTVLDVSSFDTSNVTNMGDMFSNCSSLTTLDVSSFDTSNVTNMGNMFSNCSSLAALDVSLFDTSNVTSMYGMFRNCSSLTVIDLRGFNVHNVTNMAYMFYNCIGLTILDLSNFDAAKVSNVSSLLGNCTNLKTIYTPYNLIWQVQLPAGGTWYRSDGTTVTGLPQNLSESIVLGKDYIPDVFHPDTPPLDIVEDNIIVNGKGYAYANFILKNNKGAVQKNAIVNYSIAGQPYYVISDDAGRIAIKSQLLTNTSGQEERDTIAIKNMCIQYPSGETELLDYSVTMNYTVTPLSYTQSWELGVEGSVTGSIGEGVEATVGVAKVEASLAKAEISGSLGGTLSVEHSWENGTRNLSLFQRYSAEIAAKAEAGPAVQAEILNREAELKAATVGAGAAAGTSAGVGLKVENYDPGNIEQLMDIGIFMLGAQAQAGGNMMLLQLAELAGLDFCNLEQVGATLSMEAEADIGSIEFGDAAKGAVLAANADQTISFDMAKDKTNATRELTFGHEINAGIGFGELSILNMKDDIFSKSANSKLEVSAEFMNNDQIQNFTVKKEESAAEGFLHETGTAVSSAVTYDRETLDQLKNSISVVGTFIAGTTQYILGDAQQELFLQLDATPLRGSYTATVAEQKSVNPEFDLGLKIGLGLEAGVGLEGAYSCEYESEGGYYESGRVYVTSKNEIEDVVKAESSGDDIFKLIGEALDSIKDVVGTFLQDKWDYVQNSVENAYAKIEENVSEYGKKWKAHIVAFKEKIWGSSSAKSYQINAYSVESPFALASEENAGVDVNEYVAYTIGDPYCVYVTDEAENEVPDYSASPLTLTLSYTDEMLASAGLSETEVNKIGIYKYSADFCGYVCIGGTVDAAKKSVSVEITKPGQYVLAIDSAAPSVREVRVSQNTNKPLIKVFFNETSGFQAFSMKLDGEEVIGTADWNKYYNKALNSFSYQVETELTEGAHICSVYAVDTAGNAMTVPYEIEFTIGEKQTEQPDEPVKPGQTGDVLEEDIPTDGVIPDGIWVAGIEDSAYTGKNISQSFRLYDSTKRLKEKTDYTVSYKNNKTAYSYTDEDFKAFEENLERTGQSVKAGSFDPKKAPQVIIQMKGNYTGKKTVYFRINPRDISEDDFEADSLAVTYTGKKQTPAPVLLWNGKALKYGSDFSIPEYDSVKNNKNAFRDSQTYMLTLVGNKNFTGKRQITLTISNSAKQIAINKVAVSGIKNMPWTGEQVTQTGFTLKYGKKILDAENGEYTVRWGTNTDVGTGTVTFTGTGEDRDGDGYSFIGTKKVSFKITGTAMSKVSISGVEKKYSYTGTAIEPKATLTFRADNKTETATLTEGKHYSVTFQKNTDKGTAAILFTGLPGGGYTGTKKLTFKIVSSEIDGTNAETGLQISFVDTAHIKDGIYSAPYMKGGAKPEVIVTVGAKTLEAGKDYNVKYTNNKKPALATDNKAPAVTIIGKGNYKGRKTVPFSITTKALSNENGITIVAKDKIVSTKANGFRQIFKVYDADGKALGSGDYDSKNVTYSLLTTKKEDGTILTENKVLDKNSVVPADSVVQITVKGKGVYAGGEATGTYRILKTNYDISKATIQINNQAYTGRPVEISQQDQFKTDKVFIKFGSEKKELVLGKDIEVVPGSYVKNINKGTAKVTFRGINDFGGSKTISYKIGTRSITDVWKGIYKKVTRFFG